MTRAIAATNPSFRLLAWCLLLAAPFIAGCRSVSMNVTEGVTPRPGWSVAVFPLDDTKANHMTGDYTVYGTIGAQGSGALIGRVVAEAFAAHERFESDSAEKLRLLMRRENFAPSGLATIDDGKACQFGREIGVNMLVRGAVRHYDTSWVLFVPRVSVDLEIVALDPELNRVLWSARASDSSHIRSERTMVESLAREVAKRVVEKLVAPEADKS